MTRTPYGQPGHSLFVRVTCLLLVALCHCVTLYSDIPDTRTFLWGVLSGHSPT